MGETQSQKGACEGRCAGVGLRHNLGPGWGTATWEKMTGKEANSVFKTYCKNYSKGVENDRKCKATEEVTQEGRQCSIGKQMMTHSKHKPTITAMMMAKV